MKYILIIGLVFIIGCSTKNTRTVKVISGQNVIKINGYFSMDLRKCNCIRQDLSDTNNIIINLCNLSDIPLTYNTDNSVEYVSHDTIKVTFTPTK
jgi:hypothetical protein